MMLFMLSSRTSTAEILGTVYKRLSCVLIGYYCDLPLFGQVQDIVMIENSRIQLVVQVLSTCCFNDHYYSYEVAAISHLQ